MAVTIDGTNGITSPDFEPSSSTTPTNGLFLPAANAVGFATGSTERLRIDSSGNVGIGTSSPSAKLDVKSQINVTNSGGSSMVLAKGTYFGYSSIYGATQIGGTSGNYSTVAIGYDPIVNLSGNFSGNGSEVIFRNGVKFITPNATDTDWYSTLTLKDGNLGLGVTPSAWTATNIKALQVYNAGIANNGGSTYITGNAYYGNAGAYTPYYTSTGTAQMIAFGRTGLGDIQFLVAPSGTAGNAISFTQAMTLDASGVLTVGTGANTATQRAAFLGGYTVFENSAGTNNPSITFNNDTDTGFWNPGANTIAFGTGGSERARIDSNGNLLVGTTSYALSNTNSLMMNPGGGTLYHQIASGNSSTLYAQYVYGGTAIGSITRNGTTAVTYNTSSDQRLKENIVDAPSALSSVNAIKVRSFDWKADGSHVDYGYIAQELLEVAPEAVHAPTDPEEMMGVDFGKLTPRLVKAIQELTARLEALENK